MASGGAATFELPCDAFSSTVAGRAEVAVRISTPFVAATGRLAWERADDSDTKDFKATLSAETASLLRISNENPALLVASSAGFDWSLSIQDIESEPNSLKGRDEIYQRLENVPAQVGFFRLGSTALAEISDLKDPWEQASVVVSGAEEITLVSGSSRGPCCALIALQTDRERRVQELTLRYRETEKSCIDFDDDTCCICLEQMTAGQPLRRLACFHRLHHSCAMHFLVKKPRCPLCRTHIGSFTEGDEDGFELADEEDEDSNYDDSEEEAEEEQVEDEDEADHSELPAPRMIEECDAVDAEVGTAASSSPSSGATAEEEDDSDEDEQSADDEDLEPSNEAVVDQVPDDSPSLDSAAAASGLSATTFGLSADSTPSPDSAVMPTLIASASRSPSPTLIPKRAWSPRSSRRRSPKGAAPCRERLGSLQAARVSTIRRCLHSVVDRCLRLKENMEPPLRSCSSDNILTGSMIGRPDVHTPEFELPERVCMESGGDIARLSVSLLDEQRAIGDP